LPDDQDQKIVFEISHQLKIEIQSLIELLDGDERMLEAIQIDVGKEAGGNGP